MIQVKDPRGRKVTIDRETTRVPMRAVCVGLARSHGFEQYADAFEVDDIDPVPELSERDLEHLGISFGNGRRLLKVRSKCGDKTTEPAPPKVAASTPASAAERRQVTMLFCELVGSDRAVQHGRP